MAGENPSWGYDRIAGDMQNLRHDVSDQSVGNIHSIRHQSDVLPVILPPKSPNLNSQLERYFGSLKSECLGCMIFFGRRSLERAVRAYVEHYHTERNHQGIGNRLIDPGEHIGEPDGEVECTERLGGLLRYYHRAA